MLSLGSLDSRLIYGDNGTIGVSNKAMWISNSIGEASSIRISSIGSDRGDSTSSSSVISLCSLDSRLIYGDNGTIRVSNKALGVSSSIWLSRVGSVGVSSICQG